MPGAVVLVGIEPGLCWEFRLEIAPINFWPDLITFILIPFKKYLHSGLEKFPVGYNSP